MTAIGELNEKQLRMQELCKVLESLEMQRDNTRVSRINADIAYTNLNSLIVSANDDIARLEAAGIKRPTKDEVKEAVKEAQEKQLSQGQRRA
jgi:ribosomal protein L12E/L44/L45/RPP1/RPP2